MGPHTNQMPVIWAHTTIKRLEHGPTQQSMPVTWCPALQTWPVRACCSCRADKLSDLICDSMMHRVRHGEGQLEEERGRGKAEGTMTTCGLQVILDPKIRQAGHAAKATI